MPTTRLIDEDGREITRAEIPVGRYLRADGIDIPAGETAVKTARPITRRGGNWKKFFGILP